MSALTLHDRGDSSSRRFVYRDWSREKQTQPARAPHTAISPFHLLTETDVYFCSNKLYFYSVIFPCLFSKIWVHFRKNWNFWNCFNTFKNFKKYFQEAKMSSNKGGAEPVVEEVAPCDQDLRINHLGLIPINPETISSLRSSYWFWNSQFFLLFLFRSRKQSIFRIFWAFEMFIFHQISAKNLGQSNYTNHNESFVQTRAPSTVAWQRSGRVHLAKCGRQSVWRRRALWRWKRF